MFTALLSLSLSRDIQITSICISNAIRLAERMDFLENHLYLLHYLTNLVENVHMNVIHGRKHYWIKNPIGMVIIQLPDFGFLR